MPTIADPPPKVGGKEIQSEEFQNRAFGLLGIASISGCCQVKISLSLSSPTPPPCVCVVFSVSTSVYVIMFEKKNKYTISIESVSILGRDKEV